MSFQNTGLAEVLFRTRKKESVGGPFVHFFRQQGDLDVGRLASEVARMESTAMKAKVFYADTGFKPITGVWLPCSL